jgi:hypothetical protein
LDQNALDWYAARLAIAVHDTNAEQQMSIQAFREALKHIPGAGQMVMRYGAGGRTQIFTVGENEVEVGPDATAADIEAALERKKKDKNSITQLQRLNGYQA